MPWRHHPPRASRYARSCYRVPKSPNIQIIPPASYVLFPLSLSLSPSSFLLPFLSPSSSISLLLSESKDSIDTRNHRSLTCGRAKSRLDCGLFVAIPVQFKIGIFFIFGTSDRIIRGKRRQANRRSAWRCIVDDCVNGGPSLPPNATSFH